MIIEHTTIKFHSRREHIDHAPLRKQSKPIDAKKLLPQANYNSLTHKQSRSKHDTPLHQDKPDTDTYRDLLSKRERNRETESRLEHRPRKAQDNPPQRNAQQHNKSYSKSKSREKSKGIAKSRSLKQLGKKSKSMVRLEVREVRERREHHIEKTTKEERKSESPHKHAKSTTSIVEKKNYKSNYVSKTNREYTSEITTDREKSKGKLKISQISKPSKKQQKLRDFKKKSAPKIIHEKKRRLQRESSKNEKKAKPIIKVKKEKKVIMSQQNSKFRRNEQQWQSSQNQDEFLDPKQGNNLRQKKEKSKQANMVQIPKRKQRLSLNANSKRCFKVKNTKTEAQVEVQKERMKDMEQWAAITIQKVFRGYLTRKYIRECFEHNAAISIQRVWRGHTVRLQLERERKGGKGYKILQHQQYLLQKSSSREDSLRNSNIYAQKWASILEEILSQQSVNSDIKKKIELFLQRQRKEMSEFDYRSNRSSSANSNISNQVISNEINSEKHFMENLIQQEKRKKMYPHMQVYLSPTNHYRSPKRYSCTSPQGLLLSSPQGLLLSSPQGLLLSRPQGLLLSSPQGLLLSSPTYHLPERHDEAQELTSSELLISHLKSIQSFHKERLQRKAKDEREELNKLLIKNMLTPRTHEKKYKEVEQELESELEKFNESINEIVKNCILYKESPNASRENKDKHKPSYEELMEFNDDSMITPKKELLQLHVPFEMPEECLHSQKLPIQGENAANFKKLQEKSQQFHEYYKAHHEQKKQPSCEECFDTSYQFIEEYLINLIDFMRQYEGGCNVSRVLSYLHKPRSHQVPTIIHNMSVVTEGSQQDDLESSFKLPLYKYIELDEQIIQPELIQAFHLTFPKIGQNELQECFVKMVVECMNEALNSLRPTSYIFSQTQLSTLNYLRSMQRVPLFQSDNSSEEEMQYQFMLAQTLNKIFYWNKLEWGKLPPLRPEEAGDRLEEMKEALERQEQAAMTQLSAGEQWAWYQQLVEIISQLSEELFMAVLFEEVIEIAWNTGIRRNNPKQHLADIRLPDNANFYQD